MFLLLIVVIMVNLNMTSVLKIKIYRQSPTHFRLPFCPVMIINKKSSKRKNPCKSMHLPCMLVYVVHMWTFACTAWGGNSRSAKGSFK